MGHTASSEATLSATDQPYYSRDSIQGNAEVAPYVLHGARRTIFLAIYFSIVAISFGGILYSLFVSPAVAAFGIVTAYLSNNLAFSITHVRYHSSFLELPESKMEVLLHNSLVHHYRDTEAYHKNWLESRVSYFIDPKDGIFSSIFITVIPAVLLLATLLYMQLPILGVTYLSTMWAAQLLQGTIHEWYHYPARNRKSYYNPLTYWGFTLLEKIGIASTKKHAHHHRHQLKTLNEVEQWLDLYLPFGEALPTLLWNKALSMYKPGQIRMVPFVSLVIYSTYVVLHVGVSLAYVAIFT